MQEPSEEERLRRLAARLAELRRDEDPAARTPEHHTQAQFAWRMVTELVAGLLVGFGIGFGLDALFGTRPWLMLTFTLLGFAAGVQTMLRTAREMQGRDAGGTGGAHPPRRPEEGAAPDHSAGTTQEEDERRG